MFNFKKKRKRKRKNKNKNDTMMFNIYYIVSILITYKVMKQKKSINQMLDTNINTNTNTKTKRATRSNKIEPIVVKHSYDDDGEIVEIDDNINNNEFELTEPQPTKPKTRSKVINSNIKTTNAKPNTKKLSSKVSKVNKTNKINDEEINDESELVKSEETQGENEKNIIPIKIKDNTSDPNHSKASINFDTIDLCQEIKKKMEDNKKLRLSRMVIPWTEKYRPNKLEDLLIDDITREKLRKIINNKQMPNILITGGPGEGKTSTILLIAKLILGLNFKEALLELNASDERGIKTHNHVINFCKKKLHFDEENANEYAKHKIILLDEADNMTKKGQQSISNLMEVHKSTTRFAFTCNNSGDIIEAIQSRCMIFRYNKLNQDQITHRLKFICKQEDIKYTDDGIKSLVIISDGDMRNAVNNLQVMYNSRAYNSNGGITMENVYKLSDKPKPQVIKKILLLCYKRDIRSAMTEINIIRDKGYSTADILNCMQNLIIYDEVPEIKAETQHHYLLETSKTLHTINQGIDTALQLDACVIAMCSY